jgi:hypothetical protein
MSNNNLSEIDSLIEENESNTCNVEQTLLSSTTNEFAQLTQTEIDQQLENILNEIIDDTHDSLKEDAETTTEDVKTTTEDVKTTTEYAETTKDVDVNSLSNLNDTLMNLIKLMPFNMSFDIDNMKQLNPDKLKTESETEENENETKQPKTIDMSKLFKQMENMPDMPDMPDMSELFKQMDLTSMFEKMGEMTNNVNETDDLNSFIVDEPVNSDVESYDETDNEDEDKDKDKDTDKDEDKQETDVKPNESVMGKFINMLGLLGKNKKTCDDKVKTSVEKEFTTNKQNMFENMNKMMAKLGINTKKTE